METEALVLLLQKNGMSYLYLSSLLLQFQPSNLNLKLTFLMTVLRMLNLCQTILFANGLMISSIFMNFFFYPIICLCNAVEFTQYLILHDYRVIILACVITVLV